LLLKEFSTWALFLDAFFARRHDTTQTDLPEMPP
jgi:hypothetical protein